MISKYKNSKASRVYKLVLVILIVIMMAITNACLIFNSPPSEHSTVETTPYPTPTTTQTPAYVAAPLAVPETTPEPTPDIPLLYTTRLGSAILVNGETTTLHMYEIDDNIYIDLFELAIALSGTNKQFYPEWIIINEAVKLTIGVYYSTGDYNLSYLVSRNAVAKSIDIISLINETEFTASTYLVDDSILFRFEDIAETLGLIIENDTERRVVSIFTNWVFADRVDGERNIDPTLPMIALTYDDGPSDLTIEILDILEQNGVVATFFILGSLAERRSETILRAFNMGCEIANHTWSHRSANNTSVDEMRNQLQRTRDKIESITGTPSTIMRPTYGHRNSGLHDLTRDMGYPMILWSIDPSDYLAQSPEKIYEYIMELVQDKDIILLHDIHERTLEASRLLIPSLIEQGFQFVTITELLHFSGINPEPGEVYRHGR